MKSYLILSLGIILFLTACNKDTIDETTTLTDFEGTYIGTLDCVGEMADANGESFTLTITKNTNTDSGYTIFLPDDVVFSAILENNTLLIPTQLFNAEEDFDRVSMEGIFKPGEDESLAFEFTTSVDEEGESECNSILIKQ